MKKKVRLQIHTPQIYETPKENLLHNPSVLCSDVSVDIPVYSNSNSSFRNTILRKMVGGHFETKGRSVAVKALDSISFKAYKGDSIGILGHNGSGKTTLLKVLGRIYEPSQGFVTVNGKTTPYFGMNEGLSPNMTGIEAIKVGALVRGKTSRELPAIIDEIAAFTELGDFLNLPIRTYSTGMSARLLFAIATCVPPDILLVDENIGAGDHRFQENVKIRVENFISSASTFFLASHNPTMMVEWCTKGLLLRKGRLLFYGEISEAIRQYNNGQYLPEHDGIVE